MTVANFQLEVVQYCVRIRETHAPRHQPIINQTGNQQGWLQGMESAEKFANSNMPHLVRQNFIRCSPPFPLGSPPICDAHQITFPSLPRLQPHTQSASRSQTQQQLLLMRWKEFHVKPRCSLSLFARLARQYSFASNSFPLNHNLKYYETKAKLFKHPP